MMKFWNEDYESRFSNPSEFAIKNEMFDCFTDILPNDVPIMLEKFEHETITVWNNLEGEPITTFLILSLVIGVMIST